MASRWMQGVKARERSQRRRQGNASLTGYQDRVITEVTKRIPGTSNIVTIQRESMTVEERFYRPKLQELDDPQKHIDRMRIEARMETYHPGDWWRRLARLLATPLGELEFDSIEWTFIKRGKANGRTIAEVANNIATYRRLTKRYEEKPKATKTKTKMTIGREEPKAIGKDEQQRRARAKAQKGARARRGTGFLLGSL